MEPTGFFLVETRATADSMATNSLTKKGWSESERALMLDGCPTTVFLNEMRPGGTRLTSLTLAETGALAVLAAAGAWTVTGPVGEA
ncbi:UNVERIFIED_CONTAM: hypothetical protein Sradi_3799800 [Sesamum radiatum]|uniref:Uncharacterized protein n=1 Tax=Sesamum radiatum TaxID=300843 RepID=A0AAW2Q053_SESRA